MDYSQVTLHPESHVSPGATIIGDVTVGKNASIFAGATLRGDYGATIQVGDDTNIQEGVCVHVGNACPAIIGRGVTIGHGAIVHGCTVGDNTLVGMGSIIMDDAVIGNNCIVGAGALVTGGTQIPNGSLVIGSPARVKRALSPQEIESNKKSAIEYVRIGREMAGQALMQPSCAHPTAALSLAEKLSEARAYLKAALAGKVPEIGLVLGSGLNSLAQDIEDAVCIPYEDIPHMKQSTAEGHVGQFVCGSLGGKTVLAMQGRLHCYEGLTAQDVAFPIWLMSELGIGTLITTNAAGALNETFKPGDFCVMTDHINLTGRNPVACTGAPVVAPRFVPMKDAYDAALRACALTAASKADVVLHKGVYMAILGPSFETPAEIKLFRQFGADTIAMSVVEEVIAARHVGMRVLGISLISNMACGIDDANPTDKEVREVGEGAAAKFKALIVGTLQEMY